ncbi:HNH endonuclease [Streptomyces sp. EN16]|uniref:HNH endonuclease n=1 Tax=Streptomyces sp. EN16 TaxID=212773 RepID=UPI0009A095C0
MDDRTCTQCGETKPLDSFGRHKRGPQGLRTRCKPCHAAQSREVYAANLEAGRAVRAAYAAAHKSEKAVYDQEYRVRNADRLQGQRAAWRAANSDKRAASQRKRRALKAGAGHEPYTLADVLEACDYRCAYCGGPAEHLDHIVPLTRGGVDAAGNVTGACEPCNLAKSDTDPGVWIARVLSSDKPLWAL